MIQEAYVSFETAKLLREKGFDEPCNQCYAKHPKEDKPKLMFNDAGTNSKGVYGAVFPFLASAPSQQMAMRWLREVHNIVICAEIGNENDKGNTDYTNPDRWHWFFDLTNEKGVVIEPESDYILNEFDSYEDAVEAAIQYCLTNLI